MHANDLRRRNPATLFVRTVLAVVGGYVLGWGLVALFTASAFACGADFHDGETVGFILALVLYPAAFLWAFAARRLWLPSVVLVGGGALLVTTASLIQSMLT